MIQFEHCKGELRKAVFTGNIEEIMADLCVEIALIYGGLARAQGEEAAEDFREMLGHLYVEDNPFCDELQSVVFSDALTSGIEAAGQHEVRMEARPRKENREKSKKKSPFPSKDEIMMRFLAEMMSREDCDE